MSSTEVGYCNALVWLKNSERRIRIRALSKNDVNCWLFTVSSHSFSYLDQLQYQCLYHLVPHKLGGLSFFDLQTPSKDVICYAFSKSLYFSLSLVLGPIQVTMMVLMEKDLYSSG